MKNIIILGHARSGKTTLSKMIANRFNYNLLTFDNLVTSFQKCFPQIGIRHTYSKENSEILSPFVVKLVNCMVSNYPERPHIFEGSHVFPENIHNKLDKEKFKIICLGCPSLTNIEFLNSIRKFDTEDEWTNGLKDEELLSFCSKWVETCKALSSQCKKINIAFFDTSNHRQKTLEAIVSQLFD